MENNREQEKRIRFHNAYTDFILVATLIKRILQNYFNNRRATQENNTRIEEILLEKKDLKIKPFVTKLRINKEERYFTKNF